jgi:hypothetical protein
LFQLVFLLLVDDRQPRLSSEWRSFQPSIHRYQQELSYDRPQISCSYSRAAAAPSSVAPAPAPISKCLSHLGLPVCQPRTNRLPTPIYTQAQHGPPSSTPTSTKKAYRMADWPLPALLQKTA